MTGGLKGLDFSGLGEDPEATEAPKVLSAASFSPRPDGPSPAAKAAAALSSFPSREPHPQDNDFQIPKTVQINGYVPRDIALRFKAFSKSERYSYGELIALLFEHYERTKPNYPRE